ncbi:Lipase 4 [Paramyrothecium foliicola]|nr:Lipase 4 [Paramyrothecium foliicola]
MAPPFYHLLVCSLWVASLGATAATHFRRDNEPTVSVQNGTYAGIYSPGYDQDFFLGMPYAQEAMRFSLAQPLNETWEGTREAKAYPKNCVGYGSDMIGYEISEDCLYLNVIRPAGVDPNAELPVAVWIHGGGLFMGGSAERRYNLSFTVQNSVELGTPIIGVSLNYRLSAFGFLAGQEVRDAGIANNGFRDQRLALHWIKENIRAFGGSPDKITIYGESSGAESVSAHVFAYNGRDDGLFQAAIGQSGFGGILARFPGGHNATGMQQSTYDKLVDSTSCASGNPGGSLDCLRSLPFEEINTALNVTGEFTFPPILDGDFIADYPSKQLADGRFPKIPILIGSTADEGSSFGLGRGPPEKGGKIETDEDFAYAIESFISPDQQSGRSIDELVREVSFVYPNIQAVGIPSLSKWPAFVAGDEIANQFGIQTRRGAALFGDLQFHFLRRRANQVWSKAGLPSYSYLFDVTVNPIPGYLGAVHFQEVAFVLYNLNGDGYDVNPFADKPDSFKDLAKTMNTAWINFFVHHDPNGPTGLSLQDGKPWPVYDVATGGGVGEEIVFGESGAFVHMDSWRAEGINWLIENDLSVLGG